MSAERNGADFQGRIDTLVQQASRLTQVNKRLEEENRNLRGLVELACLSNAAQNLDWSLHHLAESVRGLLCSDVVCLALVEQVSGTLSLGAWSDAMSEVPGKPAFPLRAEGTGASVIGTLRGVILEDAAGQDDADAIIQGFRRHARPVSTLVAPVLDEGSCLGIIYAFRFHQPPFDEAQLGFLALFGQLAGTEVKRRRAEERLRESEERFRFIAETTGDVLYRLRYDSMQYDYLSPSIEDLTGYGRDEIQSIGFS